MCEHLLPTRYPSLTSIEVARSLGHLHETSRNCDRICDMCHALLALPIPTFSLAISLRVVGCGWCCLNTQKLVELSHEGRHKLWSPVTDDLFRETMELPDMISKESD